MKAKVRSAFTLIEILIVVVIMAILAATIIPQFTDSTADAELSTMDFNLNTLRAQIELYKAQHGGTAPTLTSGVIVGLTTQTTYNSKNFGPYLPKMPDNPFVGSDQAKASAATPIAVGDVGGTEGWIYDTTSGEIRINHATHWTK